MIVMTPMMPMVIVIGLIIIVIIGRIVVAPMIVIIFVRTVAIAGVISTLVVAWFHVYAKTLLSFRYGRR